MKSIDAKIKKLEEELEHLRGKKNRADAVGDEILSADIAIDINDCMVALEYYWDHT